VFWQACLWLDKATQPVLCSKMDMPIQKGRLTTHVLDTARGCPVAGVEIRLCMIAPQAGVVTIAVTNADGRCDKPLLEDNAFLPGTYELMFRVGAYFARHLAGLADPPFLDEIVLRFGIADSSQHYHVPLLVSPYGYSTYRGS
jgi:5-hydroxyisourate hydrolase